MNAKRLLSAGLLLSAMGAGPAQAQTPNTNVIMYIGDGFGLAPKTAARMAMGQGRDGKRFNTDANFQVLALDKLKYNATVTTHSLNSWITDSAPGASVYACGKRGKQDNEVISLDPATGQSIETILEAAKKQGYAVGIVSTARITHATPPPSPAISGFATSKTTLPPSTSPLLSRSTRPSSTPAPRPRSATRRRATGCCLPPKSAWMWT
ncbi:alkaline phosphatase [Hymenobacter volaticus]|uniref:Alkaline phosphatase n=1 Tax=Hymenobacter volaticus TaxID=2932254 RepID=A0ABY4GEY3_9BACT|nr:alkaline phosphatase [Hymenobacter volaticus]UOQ69398.1 alkaline phosphatase [Hymenobacter volaticus]